VERLRRKCVHTHPGDAETMIEAADFIESLTKTSEADVERVARAISDHVYANIRCGPATDCAEWGDMAEFDRVTYRRAARAALEAMKGGA
jgi:hypothetical protein